MYKQISCKLAVSNIRWKAKFLVTFLKVLQNPKISSRYKDPLILPLLASIRLSINVFWCGVDLIWGGKSVILERIGISFSLILSNWDYKSPSLFDISFKIVDTWPQNILRLISLPIVVINLASLKQNAKPFFTKRIGSSLWKFVVSFLSAVISNSR